MPQGRGGVLLGYVWQRRGLVGRCLVGYRKGKAKWGGV